MTALTATPQAPTATKPPSMLLQVTAAPSPPATAYTSNFTAGVDSWANVANATLTGNYTVPSTSTKTLRIQGPTTLVDATAQRALTGLTVAAPYRYRSTFAITRGEVKLVAKDTASGTVLAQTSFVTYANPTNKTVTLSLDFVPTATTVTIQIVTHQVTAFGGSTADVAAYAISVSPTGTWLGTTIYRTDANGIDVPVREDAGGLDTSAGTMTLTDWEAALNGPVSYRVADGAGASTAAAIVTHSTTRTNLAPNPRGAVNLTGWGSSYGTGGGGTLAQVATGGPLADAPSFVRSTWTTAQTVSNGSISIGSTTAGASELPAVAGDPFNHSIYLRPSIAGQTWRVRVNFYTAAGALITSIDGTNTALVQNEWNRIYCSGTVPATAARGVIVCLQVSGVSALMAVGDTVDASAVMPERASVIGTYFDGDSPNLADKVRYWTGTAHASASRETVETPALGVWVTLPATATPSAGATGSPLSVPVPQVTNYDEEASTTGSIHQIIGRPDKIANPGPLSTRSGTLELLELDYAQAKALRVLLANGDVGMLRQPTHPGLDLYFTTTSVRITPEGPETLPRRFTAAVAYEEVVAP